MLRVAQQRAPRVVLPRARPLEELGALCRVREQRLEGWPRGAQSHVEAVE